ncbi:G-type lectin S-receptor-like serine/threonine-protein kinase RLK1 [Morella rubra]|uniref:G-type lectin S-receptor-like serine/threonine-protein kinase RLK1 n=1 Tax=Morella rubra TaxID=262757 RepID=A0A6A1W751_9ROSI|nr:G-type lectin S-receptor-like serine/threonine-protein kinase RLK1 [Morella rubra]
MALAWQYPLFCLLLVLLLLYYPTSAQISRNISLGSFLRAENTDSYWASPSGDFAFGFHQIGTGGYLLAIWFDKIQEKTIVWSANGNNMVPRGSKVELTKDGHFVLNDPAGKEMWKAELFGSRVAYAAMLDTGNFVLATEDSRNSWETFDHPTDTMLPTMTMSQPIKLVARYSEANYSNGRFQLTLQSDGNLVLETRAFPLDLSNAAYWSSNTIGSGFQLVFDPSGSVYLTAKDRSPLKMITSNGGSTKDFYQRAILEHDGVFRHYIYPKNPTISSARRPSEGWSPMSTFIPSNICTAITQLAGAGACGFNSYCKLGDDHRPSCLCPDGYTFIDPDDVMKGCKQNFLPQSCEESLSETDRFDFRYMPNTDWPLSDYEIFYGQTEDWCWEACLGDCFCAVAIFRNGGCFKKRVPLSNGRMNSSITGMALIKIRKDNSTLSLNPSSAALKKKDLFVLILSGFQKALLFQDPVGGLRPGPHCPAPHLRISVEISHNGPAVEHVGSTATVD